MDGRRNYFEARGVFGVNMLRRYRWKELLIDERRRNFMQCEIKIFSIRNV